MLLKCTWHECTESAEHDHVNVMSSFVCWWSFSFCLVDAIRNGIDILVGTPGRVKDHLQNNKLDLSKLKHVVLDEVDTMLDMGFADQVEEILSTSYAKGKVNLCCCCCNLKIVCECVYCLCNRFRRCSLKGFLFLLISPCLHNNHHKHPHRCVFIWGCAKFFGCPGIQ